LRCFVQAEPFFRDEPFLNTLRTVWDGWMSLSQDMRLVTSSAEELVIRMPLDMIKPHMSCWNSLPSKSIQRSVAWCE
jgi:hypothetical protein